MSYDKRSKELESQITALEAGPQSDDVHIELSGLRWTLRHLCRKCGADGRDCFSLGIFAGRYCDPCWEKSGYRKEGPEGFDPADAGESYDEPD